MSLQADWHTEPSYGDLLCRVLREDRPKGDKQALLFQTLTFLPLRQLMIMVASAGGNAFFPNSLPWKQMQKAVYFEIDNHLYREAMLPNSRSSLPGQNNLLVFFKIHVCSKSKVTVSYNSDLFMKCLSLIGFKRFALALSCFQMHLKQYK